tara:strand:- start:24 stop:482 length:459 start_codon:yes stop_codon:yes gene_type:complete
MKAKFKIIIFIYMLLASCGYKVLDKASTNNYEIKDIKITGDVRTNYKIKNHILINSKKNAATIVNLAINTKISKSVKEKNIKNEITKYNLTLNANISIYNIETPKTIELNFSLIDEYSVGNNYLTTINNEKSAKQKLAKKASDLIIKKINNL